MMYGATEFCLNEPRESGNTALPRVVHFRKQFLSLVALFEAMAVRTEKKGITDVALRGV